MTTSPPALPGPVILDTNVISELMLETPDAHVAALATRSTSDFTLLGLDPIDPWRTDT